MTRRETKPIDLKALEADGASTLTGMIADLERKRAARRPKGRASLWTREFLASGKSGKFSRRG